jgi:hypothetical protein
LKKEFSELDQHEVTLLDKTFFDEAIREVVRMLHLIFSFSGGWEELRPSILKKIDAQNSFTRDLRAEGIPPAFTGGPAQP